MIEPRTGRVTAMGATASAYVAAYGLCPICRAPEDMHWAPRADELDYGFVCPRVIVAWRNTCKAAGR